MFERLFKYPGVVARHQHAPLANERIRYLAHRAEQSLAPTTLVGLARELRVVAQAIDLPNDGTISPDAIKGAATRWARRQHQCRRAQERHWSREFFIRIATDWLRFLQRLEEPNTASEPCATLIEAFVAFMRDERGLSPKTIATYKWFSRQFCQWLSAQKRSFSIVSVNDVDAFLTFQHAHWCRVSMAAAAKALRAFSRYAAQQGMCAGNIATVIESPRLFHQETLPMGPMWTEVQRMIAQTDTDQPQDIRDRAMLLLLSIYGLRSGEVATLQLEHIDWTKNRLTITRSKQRCAQEYPLTLEVGAAIVRYLKDVRPRCHRREVFLTLRAPFRSLSTSALYHLTSKRFRQLGGRFPHYGPHTLRHACASHLVAQDLSLKEIGDHLGHQSVSATRIYAKVGMNGLREVARFDLGGVR